MNNKILNCREFSVDVGKQPLMCLLAEPEQLSDCPAMLLNFAFDRVISLKEAPYDITPRMFVEAGHRVVSFDLPCHGDRVISGQPDGIAGFCAEWMSGRDVFAGFVDEGRTVIDALIQRGLSEPGRIFASGSSRGAYCALRLMAADKRIKATAAFSPVTDWCALKEFALLRNQPKLAELALTNFAYALAGRPIWAAIGNHDLRVGTECSLRFAEALTRAETAKECEASQFVLHVVPEDGHNLSDNWRRDGGEFLLHFV